MSDIHYEDAANVVRVFLEDERKSQIDDLWDLERILGLALRNRYLARNVPETDAAMAARDDAIGVVNNLDTLRPILEAYWRNH